VNNEELNLPKTAFKFDYSKYMLIFVLLALVIVSGILSPSFLKVQNILDIIWQSSYVGIIAVGVTFVMIAGGIDLSVGSLTALLGAIAITSINIMGGSTLSMLLTILITIAAGLIIGFGMGMLIVKGKVAPFIATLAGLAIYRSLVLNFANGGEYVAIPSDFSIMGMGSFAGLPIPMIVFIIFSIIAQIILSDTKFGRYVYAVGANEKTALYSAIKIGKIKILTYMISGLSVAITAILLSSMMSSVSSSTTGLNYELMALEAAVIGGTSLSGGKGTIWGTFVGAIILGVINNMLVMLNVAVYLQGAFQGFIIIIAVLLQNIGKK